MDGSHRVTRSGAASSGDTGSTASQLAAAAASASAVAAAGAASTTGTVATVSALVVPPSAPTEGGVVVRPTAVTRNGIRQFVETENHIRIFLQNTISTVNLKCAPDLEHIATHARNAEYNPDRFRSGAMLRLREPRCTALIFRSGKMVVTGARNEDDSQLGARKATRIMQRLGFDAQFEEFKVQNVVGTADVGFPIRLEGIAHEHARFCSYEPELFPGLIYRLKGPDFKCTLLIFVSGRLVITGCKRRSHLVAALEMIFPVLLQQAIQTAMGQGNVLFVQFRAQWTACCPDA